MIETSGMKEGDEIARHKKKKIENKMNSRLSKDKRFKKDDKHSKRKKVKK